MNNNIFDIAKITRMYSLDNEIKKLTKERDAIKKPIADYMKTNDVTEKTVGQYRFTVTEYTTPSVDYEKLREMFPQAFAECVTEKPVKRFNM